MIAGTQQLVSFCDAISVKRNLKELLAQLREVSSFADIPGIRKLQGHDKYYRLRIGEYRLGIKAETTHIEVVRFLHRKDVYGKFP